MSFCEVWLSSWSSWRVLCVPGQSRAEPLRHSPGKEQWFTASRALAPVENPCGSGADLSDLSQGEKPQDILKQNPYKVLTN